MKKYVFSLLAVLSLILAGCGSTGTNDQKSSESKQEEHDHASHTQQADIQEKTKGVDTLPTFLDKLRSTNERYLHRRWTKCRAIRLDSMLLWLR